MKKHLPCRAMGRNCGFEVHDGSEEEVTTAIGDYRKRARGVEFTEALRKTARDRILLDPV
ncbi:MAG: hypothetical protein OHK0028_22320 [Deltaproteobacteria bacterium]